MTMTKATSSSASTSARGFSKKEATEIVESIFEVVKRRLEQGEKVKVSGRNSWSTRRPRKGTQTADRRET
jgi:integration host factor subunit alpha